MKKSAALFAFSLLWSAQVRGQSITSAQSGPWSLGTTWTGGIVPGSANTVTIQSGHTVTVDITTATAQSLTVKGTLSFSRVFSSSLTMAGGDATIFSGGTLDMGGASSPIPMGVNATLVLSYGVHGLIINSGGAFTVYGATKTPVALATADAFAGSNSISIDDTGLVGWQVGDSITVGMTARSGTNQTERRTITSLVGSNPLVVGLSAPTLSYDHTRSVTPIRVANLTRNVLVRSSGTNVNADTGYIRDLATSATSFSLAYGEFAYLGSSASAFKFGITLDNASAGIVSSCTVRDGYTGIYTAVSITGTFSYNVIYNHQSYGINSGNGTVRIVSNDVYSNQSAGINVKNAQAVIDSNNVYSNSDAGISLQGASPSTVKSNRAYSSLTAQGINDTATNAILISNLSYLNSSDGIVLGSGSSGNVSIGNFTYANGGRGLYVDRSSANVVAGDSLGYDSGGNPSADLSSELQFNSSGSESLVAKSLRVNPAAGISINGFNRLGNLLLSYNQDSDQGSLRAWGDFVVSGATLALSYAGRLYPSTATAPSILWGNSIGAISVNSTNDAKAVSQLVSVSYDGAQWNVLGSASGLLGTFAVNQNNAPFPAVNPQFNLTFSFSSPQAGDRADFVLIAASNDSNAQKKLLFGSSVAPFNGGRSKLTVASSAGLNLVGTPGAPTLVGNIPGNNFYTVVDSGDFTMAYATVTNMDSGGLQLSGSGGVSISSSVFDFMGFTQTTSAYITAAGLTSNATFYSVEFDLSQSTAGHPYSYNVLVQPPDGGLNWVFFNYSGPFAGQAYDYDPNGRVQWNNNLPRVTALSPAAGSACAVPGPIVLNFSKAMSAASLSNALTVTATQDNLGNTISQLIPGVTSYASNQLTFSGALTNNTLYQVILASSAMDTVGNAMPQAFVAQFRTLLDRTALNVINDNATGVSVTVPPGALAANGTVQPSLTVSANLGAANQKLVSNSGDPHRYPVGTVVDLKAYDNSCQNQQNGFSTPLTVSLPYPDSNNDGIVDGSNPPVRTSTLGVWYLDDSNALWVRLPSSQVDLVAKRVAARTPHFTTFALIGAEDTNVDGAFAFPVPFKPSLGHTAITFSNLPQTASVRIFTVSGKLVQSLDASDGSGKFAWDVRSSDGKDVASGVYVYLVTSGPNSKTGKLVIVR